MPYTAQFFAEKLNVPVEYFNPFRSVQIAPEVNLEEMARTVQMLTAPGKPRRVNDCSTRCLAAMNNLQISNSYGERSGITALLSITKNPPFEEGITGGKKSVLRFMLVSQHLIHTLVRLLKLHQNLPGSHVQFSRKQPIHKSAHDHSTSRAKP